MKEKFIIKKNKEKDLEIAKKKDNTYTGEGMLYGVAAGSIIGAIITMFSSITYLPICTSIGMMLGFAIGSNIKKGKKKK